MRQERTQEGNFWAPVSSGAFSVDSASRCLFFFLTVMGMILLFEIICFVCVISVMK